MEKDIIKLQEALAHQAIEISELSDELYRQQKELNAFKNYIQIMEAKFQVALEAGNDINLPQDDAPPPHY